MEKLITRNYQSCLRVWILSGYQSWNFSESNDRNNECFQGVSTMTLKRFIYGETFFGTDVTLSSCGNTYGLKIQLHTDDVSGLQVFKDGEWIAVEALPHAFVINVGYQLQIISNGKLKSSEHRAVTNSDHARTSAAFFVAPSDEIVSL
ncbi:hypothetical protein P8452_08239 [Trifolium repens]|nr:hypothetical protein P8452_08239 [Trifolium repens]